MKQFKCIRVFLFILLSMQLANAETITDTGINSDRIRVNGGSSSSDLYASGNDDAFQSFGVVTFNFTAAEFGLTSLADIQNITLSLTFNDRGFSDGTQFQVFFTSDDFATTGYPGLSYDDSGVNDPHGINPNQFTSLTSLGIYDLGFDQSDSSNGGMSFDYNLNFSSVKTELINEINSGSDFTILLGAVNNADDVTFSGVGNQFDPGDPELTISTTALDETIQIVTRVDIAKPILQKIYGPNFQPSPAQGGTYLDVPANSTNASWIEKLEKDGITKGCDVFYYCPNMAVTKEQMAKLIIKAKFGPNYIPSDATGQIFSDVSKSSFAARWIEELFNQSYTKGCDNDRYCPKETITIETFENILNIAFP